MRGGGREEGLNAGHAVSGVLPLEGPTPAPQGGAQARRTLPVGLAGTDSCESGLPDDIRHGWANKLSAACETNCDTDTLVFLPRLSNTACDGKQLLDPGEKIK